MAKFLKAVDWYVHAAMLVSMGLFIAAFIVPPTGSIDPSVLAAGGEMTGATAVLTFLAKLPEYIEKGITARVIKNGTTIEVGGKKDESNQNNTQHKTP